MSYVKTCPCGYLQRLGLELPHTDKNANGPPRQASAPSGSTCKQRAPLPFSIALSLFLLFHVSLSLSLA